MATAEDYEYIDDMRDDLNIKREIILEADAETLARMRKEGHARGFTVYCDEGGGLGAAITARRRRSPSLLSRWDFDC